MRQHMLGFASKQHPLNPFAAMRCHDHQIAGMLLNGGHDGFSHQIRLNNHRIDTHSPGLSLLLHGIYHRLAFVAPLLFSTSHVLHRNSNTTFKVADRVTGHDVEGDQFRALTADVKVCSLAAYGEEACQR